jgi:enoyl-CoA hydratase/carnithine racemase
MGQPIELRFYQRYSNNPLKASGVQFLTHLNHHQRWRARGDYIDYMNWGREQGQARLPHRHQRVAFDFNDSMPPTKAAYREELFASQDPSSHRSGHDSMDDDFNPNKKVFSGPQHWNRLFSKRRAGEGDIRVAEFGTKSLLGDLVSYTDVDSESAFHVESRTANHGLVPGINQPFLGEQDTKMMQSMSVPLDKEQLITTNDGRFSKSLYLNNPSKHQHVSASLAKKLASEIDRSTNAVHSKLTTLSAAQSGLTDYFCQGIDFEQVAHHQSMANVCKFQVEGLNEEVKLAGGSKGSPKLAQLQHKIQDLLDRAQRHEQSADAVLRQNAGLLWRVFTAARPFMTVINGRCRGTGCGVGLMAKYAVTRDSSEFTFDGPNRALTPFGGLTHFLARPETSLKFPGLAEFTMLTGSSLFAGDVLRLGWTDLFSATPDLEYHIKEWFNNTEHMHNDAIAWQLGHLLESTCKMRDAHSGAVERSSVTPTRANWIEDAFADQPSVESIVSTLSQMERVSVKDPNNTVDFQATVTPYTLPSVDHGVSKLRATNMHFSLEPWDITAPIEPIEAIPLADIFSSYVLERRGDIDVALNTDRLKLSRWRDQRYKEYKEFQALKKAPQVRHVFARLEGCEGKLVDFEFVFDKNTADEESRTIRSMQNALHRKAGNSTSSLANADELAEIERLSMVEGLKAEIRNRLDFPGDRNISIGWYLPTLDTAEVLTDEELLQILRTDPGVEGATQTKFPPIYFIVKRREMYMSEWAYAVKHQLLLQSPFALKASFALLQSVRGDGSHEQVSSISESLTKEFRYLRRMITRPEFFNVGQHTERDMAYWEDVRDRRSNNIHETEQSPLRPMKLFSEVFEGNVVIDGHKFQCRPRWFPRTLEDVNDTEISRLAAPLDFGEDFTTELDVPTFSAKQDFIQGMVDDAGVEVVPGLGEPDRLSAATAPLLGNAHVPENVNFYEMARHPWNDKQTSWRQDGFTAGSQEYFMQQYQAAEKELYDSKGTGQHSYWPSTADAEKVSSWVEDEAALLQDRFYAAFRDGEQQVDGWANELRKQATSGGLTKRLEIATSQEKVMDDEYYRWFIQPGVHPNPSGLLRGGLRAAGATADGDVDAESVEVQRVLSTLGDAQASQDVATDLDMFYDEAAPAEAPSGDDPVEGL